MTSPWKLPENYVFPKGKGTSRFPDPTFEFSSSEELASFQDLETHFLTNKVAMSVNANVPTGYIRVSGRTEDSFVEIKEDQLIDFLYPKKNPFDFLLK